MCFGCTEPDCVFSKFKKATGKDGDSNSCCKQLSSAGVYFLVRFEDHSVGPWNPSFILHNLSGHYKKAELYFKEK